MQLVERVRAKNGLASATALVVMVPGLVYLTAEISVHRSVVVLAVWSVAALAVRGVVSGWIVMACIGVLGSVAIADVPYGTDLWFYQSYGRIVEEYRANPYVVAPVDFIGDPVVDRTADFYRDSGSIYGPVFVVGATVVSALSGTGELAGRMAWQTLSMLAVVGIIILLRRRQVSWDHVLLVGASPTVVYLLVNQAHNDVFVGLLVLLGAGFATKSRHVPATIALAAAALIKAPSGIALVTYLVWLLARGDRRAATRSVLAAAVFAALFVIPFGIRAVLNPLSQESGTTNATSIWNLVRGDALTFVWRPERSVDTRAGTLVSIAGIVVPLGIAALSAWRMRTRPVHEPLTIALLGWVVFSLYPSVWLTGWFVALAGLWGTREMRLLMGYASLLLVTSQAWLMPVAALVDHGSYGLVERLAAPLLGVASIAGVGLIAHLLGSERRNSLV